MLLILFNFKGSYLVEFEYEGIIEYNINGIEIDFKKVCYDLIFDL